MIQLPYLTCELPGIGGRLREHLTDFQVQEIPLYEPSGQGTHVYFRVRKAGIPTPAAVGRVARYMGVKPMDIGFAGMKDAQAVTSQMMSLEHADERKLAAFRDSQMEILDISRHTNKLRTGHLAGNRFVIRIRDVGAHALPAAQAIADVLTRRGVPNYFGEQRFGARGDTGILGRALLRNDLDEFVKIFLGRSAPDDPPDCKAARDAFDAGFLDRALKCWPRHYSDQRRALSAFKKRRRAIAAVLAIDKRMKRLFVSAFQSEIFNAVLALRVGQLDRLQLGDLALKTDGGGVFLVEDLASEQARADRFEISPTGPVPGMRSRLAEGDPGLIERQVMEQFEVKLEDFDRVGALKISGSRRPLRFPPRELRLSPGEDRGGSYLELAFTAPPGCYATVVLREIMKADLPAEDEE